MQQLPFQLPASKAEICRVIGTDDEGLLARIAATQVTYVELLEAYLWLAGDDQLESSIGEPVGRLARLIDLLLEERVRRGQVDD
jgi:hypothetical protein